MPLLEIEDLHVDFPTQGGLMRAVDGVSLTLDEGHVLGIVGESGSGKSVTMLALMGLVAFPGRVRAKRLAFGGQDLLALPERARRKVLGRDIAMIFQEPTTSLNPCFTIGFQLEETLRLHLSLDRKEARKRAIQLLEQVGIPAAASRMGDFPHQMSGGMNQRVMIAMAIACNPKLLIADEPTTALDVTIQAQILDLLRDLQRERGMALVLVTHNMGVVAEMAHRVAVMYAGQVMEARGADELFRAPQHPYTAALLAAMPERHLAGGRLATIPGVVPGLLDRPAGCLFQPRCPDATPYCAQRPELRAWEHGVVRCHYPLSDAQREARMGRDGGRLPSNVQRNGIEA
ncbi:MAG: ABC transporter ATP-binding protein [Burkholderiales bacterium]